MFFEDVSEIERIASHLGTTVFVVPAGVEFEIKNAILLKPEEKSVITIEQVRQVLERLAVRQTSDVYVVIRPAELMNVEAANAFLKALEEPNEKVHFILVTDAPSALLPTTLSRAAIYFMRISETEGIAADEKIKSLAKRMLVAKGADLVALAEEIAKKKEGVRAYALEIVGVAIQMLYKSYFMTGKEIFVRKLPKFLQLYEGIAKNGNVKLQIVANLC